MTGLDSTGTGELLASWRPPMWAATTRVTDSQVVHWLEASTTAFVETEAAGGEPGPVTPEASQVDFLDVVDGVMTVRRAGPYVTIDCLQFSLDQAQVLALGILEVVEVVRRDAAGEAVTADQAPTGSRLPERTRRELVEALAAVTHMVEQAPAAAAFELVIAAGGGPAAA